MKKLVLFFLSTLVAFASSLQELPETFSQTVKEKLLKEFERSSKLHSSKNYNLHKGWNRLITPKNGVNVPKTFNDTSKIKYVVTYYETGKLWAIYAPSESFNNMLFLKYLEPHITFFVLAKKATEVNIESNHINSSCEIFINDKKNYGSVTDSGISRTYSVSSDKIMALQSRYYSHHDRGIYNDTRVTLIYPKYKSDKKRTFKYGPAIPKIAIRFPKAYEGKSFYVYDYKLQKCYQGLFPSLKIPPFPVMKEIK